MALHNDHAVSLLNDGLVKAQPYLIAAQAAQAAREREREGGGSGGGFESAPMMSTMPPVSSPASSSNFSHVVDQASLHSFTPPPPSITPTGSFASLPGLIKEGGGGRSHRHAHRPPVSDWDSAMSVRWLASQKSREVSDEYDHEYDDDYDDDDDDDHSPHSSREECVVMNRGLINNGVLVCCHQSFILFCFLSFLSRFVN